MSDIFIKATMKSDLGEFTITEETVILRRDLDGKLKFYWSEMPDVQVLRPFSLWSFESVTDAVRAFRHEERLALGSVGSA